MWICYNQKVYDITDFMFDHPGGQDILLQYAGLEINELMQDESIHAHSQLAFAMLEEYCIGTLEECKSTMEIKEKVQFIDISKPMFYQVLESDWTREFYLKQVHISRHSKTSAPIFGGLLEPLTLTSWYVVPIVWIPFAIYLLHSSLTRLHSPLVTLLLTATGVFLWTRKHFLMQ